MTTSVLGHFGPAFDPIVTMTRKHIEKVTVTCSLKPGIDKVRGGNL